MKVRFPSLILLTIIGLGSLPAWTADKRGDHQRFRETREQTLRGSRDLIEVDGRLNGGISVQGWDKNEMLVKAKIQTWADTKAEAEDLAREIEIQYDDEIFAQGPDQKRHSSWSVSFEIFVPFDSNLNLKTHNGGISIAAVQGEIRFKALNGGVVLSDLAGDVMGRTTNGGVIVDLTGDRWDGNRLDVTTTNGGVEVNIPEDYSADFETGTVNGRIHVDFPVMVQGKIGKSFATKLGDGGSLIRVKTTNGGVQLQRS